MAPFETLRRGHLACIAPGAAERHPVRKGHSRGRAAFVALRLIPWICVVTRHNASIFRRLKRVPAVTIAFPKSDAMGSIAETSQRFADIVDPVVRIALRTDLSTVAGPEKPPFWRCPKTVKIYAPSVSWLSGSTRA